MVKPTLYPFQREAVERAKMFNGRCLLALSMGCGKTVISATYAIETESYPILVVCPATLKYNWRHEFWKHYRKEATILSGTKPYPLQKMGQRIYIINYDVVYAWVDELTKLKPSVIIFDESQMLKTPSARRTKACAVLAFQADKMLALSGTPMMSNPLDLYTTLNMIFKGQIVSRNAFMNRYTNWFETKYGIQIKSARNVDELHNFLTQRCMVRYKLDDVKQDLPPYTRQTVLLEMTAAQRSEYKELQDNFVRWLKDKYPDRKIPKTDYSAILTMCGDMKRRVGEWKVPAVIDQLKNFIDGDDGKIIVFGLHRKVLDGIESAFSRYNKGKNPLLVRIDGSVSLKNRDEAVQSFQNNPHTRIFLGQMKAAGVGLTLTASNVSLFSELDFQPSFHLQAEARNRRIGSDASVPVTYKYTVMADTIDEKVCSTLFTRQNDINNVIDGGDDGKAAFNLVNLMAESWFA